VPTSYPPTTQCNSKNCLLLFFGQLPNSEPILRQFLKCYQSSLSVPPNQQPIFEAYAAGAARAAKRYRPRCTRFGRRAGIAASHIAAVCDGRYDTVSVVREQRVICLLVFQHTTKKPLVCHMGITLNRNVVLKFNSSFFPFLGHMPQNHFFSVCNSPH